jgi:hypothetical protein
MAAAILLLISLVALTQFALFYWRALLAGAAMRPISPRVFSAAGMQGDVVAPSDFGSLVQTHQLTPSLSQDRGGLWTIRTYFGAMKAIQRMAGARLPSLATWAWSEMTTCTRYLAVLVDQRLQQNMACAAEVRSS